MEGQRKFNVIIIMATRNGRNKATVREHLRIFYYYYFLAPVSLYRLIRERTRTGASAQARDSISVPLSKPSSGRVLRREGEPGPERIGELSRRRHRERRHRQLISLSVIKQLSLVILWSRPHTISSRHCGCGGGDVAAAAAAAAAAATSSFPPPPHHPPPLPRTPLRSSFALGVSAGKLRRTLARGSVH
jgi:hypothetical protein